MPPTTLHALTDHYLRREDELRKANAIAARAQLDYNAAKANLLHRAKSRQLSYYVHDGRIVDINGESITFCSIAPMVDSKSVRFGTPEPRSPKVAPVSFRPRNRSLMDVLNEDENKSKPELRNDLPF